MKGWNYLNLKPYTNRQKLCITRNNSISSGVQTSRSDVNCFDDKVQPSSALPHIESLSH